MRKNSVFGFIGLLFFILFVNSVFALSYSITAANNCQSPSQIIMRLSGTTNAHGALTSQAGYGYVLCGDVGGGSASCTTDNKVLGLSAATNAHAEAPDLVSPDYD